MTPKEKAKELVAKFMPYAHFYVHDLVSRKENEIMKFGNAKQCAIIAVDEILNVSLSYRDYDYYQEVKKEIINL